MARARLFTRATGAVAFALACATLTTGAAGASGAASATGASGVAAGADAPAPISSSKGIDLLAGTTTSTKPTTTQGTTQSTAAEQDAAKAEGRRSLNGRTLDVGVAATLPTEPDPAFVERCVNSSGGQSFEGRTDSRFQWCRRGQLGSEFYRTVNGQTMLIGTNIVGFTAVAFGTDQGRTVRVFFRVEPGSIDYRRWLQTDRERAPFLNFSIKPECVSSGPACTVTGQPVVQQYGRWERDGTWYRWDLESDESEQDPSDERVSRHAWHLSWKGDGGGLQAVDWANTRDRGIRCDTASYFPGAPGACVFSDVRPHWVQNLATSPFPEVTKHNAEALYNPDSTFPKPPEGQHKNIPGRWDPDEQTDPLHRVPYTSRDHDLNELAKDRECEPLPRTTGQQCDEYPFASTLEGVAHPEFDFSVKMVDGTQNGDHGNALKAWYNADRILYYDRDAFWVEVRTGGSGGGGGGGGEPDGPPTADAGPDVSGAEGGAVQLAARATDGEGTPDARWSWTAGADVDPGTTCTFGDPATARTTVSCTDDGTFTLTLTADDGVNPPVSDTTTLRLTNVAPRFSGGGVLSPADWQVFAAGDAVAVTAPFTDPGANDQQTCAVTWDDGKATGEQPADGTTCAATHTFDRAGMYTMSVRVSDDDGGVATDQVLVVVYDVHGGSLAGTGWWRSGDPAREGTVHGHVLAAYGLFDEGPEPHFDALTVRLPGDAPRLRARDLEWLVVTKDDRAAVKGTAVDDDGVEHGFVLYADDGGFAPDRARLVVWRTADGANPSTATALVHDDTRGADFDLDRAQPRRLTLGAMLVHPH